MKIIEQWLVRDEDYKMKLMIKAEGDKYYLQDKISSFIFIKHSRMKWLINNTIK